MKRAVLHKLIERCRDERDDAAVRVAQARREAQAAHATLATLHTYRGDYLGRAPTALGQCTTIARIGTHHRFVQQLERAIGEQAQRSDELGTALAARDARLAACQRRLTAFETLLARDEQAVATRERRHEQRINDEIAARARSLLRKHTP